MWQPICLENRAQISRVLDEFIRLLVQARCWVDQEKAQISTICLRLREITGMPCRTLQEGPLKKRYEIYCDIYDEAGGIATIRNAAGYE